MRWLLNNIAAALIGALVMFIISVGVWALAYYGQLDLHLPSKLDYVTLNSYIKSKLPASYDYVVEDVSKFRGTGGDTILVAANDRQLYGSSAGSGIILLLDRDESGAYQIDYRFDPVFPVNRAFGSLRVSATVASFPSSETKLVIAQWAPYAFGSPPVVGVTLGDDGGRTLTSPIYAGFASYQPSQAYRYISMQVKNKFAPYQAIALDQYQLLGQAPDGSFFALYRSDAGTCDACNHQYIGEAYIYNGHGGLSRAIWDDNSQFSDTDLGELTVFNPFGG